MKSKLIIFIAFVLLFMTLECYSKSNDVLNDPREIIIKPRAKNSLVLFYVKFSSDDFKLMVRRSFHEGTFDKSLARSCDFNERTIVDYLYRWEHVSQSLNYGNSYLEYYGESIIATVMNMESKQKFEVLIFPWMRRAFIPNVTIGKYKFVKITFTVCRGGSLVYNNDVFIDKELPEFTVNSNTAFMYGVIDLRGGEIKLTNEEKYMNKLRKYVALVKKFKKNRSMKVIELNPDEYYSAVKTGNDDQAANGQDVKKD